MDGVAKVYHVAKGQSPVKPHLHDIVHCGAGAADDINHPTWEMGNNTGKFAFIAFCQEPGAVGADEGHACLGCDLEQLLFYLFSGFIFFPESGGENDDSACSHGCQFLDGGQDKPGRNGNNCKVRSRWQL